LRRSVCGCPSCSPWQRRFLRSESEQPARWSTAIRAAFAALPQGPSLRSGLSCPGPSSLIRPHLPHWASTSRLHLFGLYAMSSLCLSASAACHWFRAFAGGPFILGMPRPRRPRRARRLHSPSSFADDVAFAPLRRSSALSMSSPSDSREGKLFEADSVRSSLRPVDLLASLSDPTRLARGADSQCPLSSRAGAPSLSQANGDVYFRASDGVGHPSRRRI
jgi:hypothetical protein